MNQVLNNYKSKALYFVLSFMLFMYTALLNATNKLVICAFIAVILIMTNNIVTEFYGKKKALISVLAALLLNCIFFGNLKYYVYGMKIDYILLGSFSAVLLSTYVSSSVIAKFQSKHSFQLRNFLGLILASVIDSAVTLSALIPKFPTGKIFAIFLKDIAIKCSYSAAVCVFLYGIIYLFNQARKKSLRKKHFMI